LMKVGNIVKFVVLVSLVSLILNMLENASWHVLALSRFMRRMLSVLLIIRTETSWWRMARTMWWSYGNLDMVVKT
jgi:hypothetical protein